MKKIILLIFFLICTKAYAQDFAEITAGDPALANSLLTSSIASFVGAYSTQISSFQEAFGNMDMAVIATRYGDHNSNLPENHAGAWFKPYTVFEDVILMSPDADIPRTTNDTYGGYFGIDSNLVPMENGFSRIISGYAAFNGSHQNFNDVGIFQSGGLVGATAAIYKGNFYSGLTTNVGIVGAHANTFFGGENFTLLTTGVASKTGYNFELLNKKLIIQPYYFMGYGFVKTFDYTSASGFNITSTPLNRIVFAPGVKIVANLKNSIQPYMRFDLVWGTLSGVSFYANDIAIPEIGTEPFFQYGGGVQKRFGERMTCYGQTIFRGGGRNGVSIAFGLRWAL